MLFLHGCSNNTRRNPDGCRPVRNIRYDYRICTNFCTISNSNASDYFGASANFDKIADNGVPGTNSHLLPYFYASSNRRSRGNNNTHFVAKIHSRTNPHFVWNE
jgi:hypothetical protein